MKREQRAIVTFMAGAIAFGFLGFLACGLEGVVVALGSFFFGAGLAVDVERAFDTRKGTS